MRARVTANNRIITGESAKSIYVGDILEGQEAAEQVALGNAEEIAEIAAEAPVGEVPEVFATQAALDHAEALGVDIAAIKGTGKDGKVTKGDVDAAVAAKEEA